jgi:hypothetical protein
VACDRPVCWEVFKWQDDLHRGAAGRQHSEGGRWTQSFLFLLFSADELGITDPGNWYRYFSAAATAYYAASGRVRFPVLPLTHKADQMARRIGETAKLLRGPACELNAAGRGWIWANALNLVELAAWSRSYPAARAAAEVAMRGAVFGITEAGHATDPSATWRDPSSSRAFGTVFSQSN